MSEQEVRTLIQKDRQLLLVHLNSLAQSSYGNKYLAALLAGDVTIEIEFATWFEGIETGIPITHGSEIPSGLTRERRKDTISPGEDY